MKDNQEVSRWLRHAIAIAVENVTKGGGPFGAVIVRNGELVAEGVNLVTLTHDATAHAEVTAIRQAGMALGTHDLAGCDMYASCEPCPMCLGAILWARMDRIWYAASKEQAAEAGFDDSLFYEQLVLPPEKRIIPTERALEGESAAPFTAWGRFCGKIRY
ncbi:MAG TPA: nucleoside deaminase [Bryobacteraceae bacterium]|nr:nucleoside deaminase [Bryobacteraceae bacterium]